jgi:hypothetical protein
VVLVHTQKIGIQSEKPTWTKALEFTQFAWPCGTDPRLLSGEQRTSHFKLVTSVDAQNGHRSWRVENDSFSLKEAADIAGKSESTLRGWSEVRGRFSLCLLRTRCSFVRDLLLVGFVAFDQKPAYPGDDQHADHNAERSGYKQSPNNPDYDCEEDSSLSHGDTELPWVCMLSGTK